MPRCRVSDCTVTRASFNILGETKGICCANHKEPGMLDVISKKCKFNGCITRPSYNFEGNRN